MTPVWWTRSGQSGTSVSCHQSRLWVSSDSSTCTQTNTLEYSGSTDAAWPFRNRNGGFSLRKQMHFAYSKNNAWNMLIFIFLSLRHCLFVCGVSLTSGQLLKALSRLPIAKAFQLVYYDNFTYTVLCSSSCSSIISGFGTYLDSFVTR